MARVKVYLEWFTMRVEDVYEGREAAIYWYSGPYKGPESVRIRDAHTKHLKQKNNTSSGQLLIEPTSSCLCATCIFGPLTNFTTYLMYLVCEHSMVRCINK